MGSKRKSPLFTTADIKLSESTSKELQRVLVLEGFDKSVHKDCTTYHLDGEEVIISENGNILFETAEINGTLAVIRQDVTGYMTAYENAESISYQLAI